MPKRKHSKEERYRKKIRRLEEKLRQCEDNSGTDTPVFQSCDWIEIPEETLNENRVEPADNPDALTSPQPEPGPSTSTLTTEPPPEENEIVPTILPIELDSEVMEILGEDPTNVVNHGPEVRKELANRLLHVISEGLSKEVRMELLAKYPTPANITQIDAPQLNPEIKAAIMEPAVKKDKGIEAKQKQMATAIACLSEVINSQLNSKTVENALLQKLIDVSRILCDIQHADSVTRRNFVLFALKQDMKDHLKNTKIGTFLFGDNLTETLRAARAVNKSGIDLKPDSNYKNSTTNRSKTATTGTKPLNRRAPAQFHRPPGQAPPPARQWQPWQGRPVRPRGPPHAPHAPPARPARSSAPSSQPHPPPPAPQRRY